MKRIKPPAELNERQRRFAELVAAGSSQTQAYIAAGYSPDGAGGNASVLISNHRVQAYVAALSEQAAEGRAAVLQERLNYLADVIRTPINEVDGDSRLCQEKKVVEHVTADGTTIVSTTIKMPSKLEAIKQTSMLLGDLKREGGGIGQLNVNVVNVRERTQEEEEAFIERFNRVTKPAINGTNGHKNGNS